MRRRTFLQGLTAAAPAAANAQHPGFAKALDAPAAGTLRYSVEDGAIVCTNGPYYNNRPLYCVHRSAAVLAGDRPLLRLIDNALVCGTFSAGIVRGDSGKWLHECDSVRMEYRAGHVTWRVSDRSLPGLRVALEAVPSPDSTGFSARLSVEGARAGDRLVWAFGGSHPERNAMWAWDPVLMPQDDGWRNGLSANLRRAFEPDKCAGNDVKSIAAMVRVSAGETGAGDASLYDDPARFAASTASALPAARGTLALAPGQAPVYWAVDRAAPAADPRRRFDAALATVREIGRRVVANTPDARLDAAVHVSNHAVDAIFYPPVFHHGCMAWNVRLPGWRTLWGGTIGGWHDRVFDQAKFYIASQVKDAKLTSADPDPAMRLCAESARSRLNGRGRILRDGKYYDMQSQMFDQLIHAWRWTGSEELERILREPLELHAEWMRECFDPDGDGLYESYINTWPTDTVWYNGGGSAEETAYAYTVHRALADMAARAGDTERAGRHRHTAGRLRDALTRLLWVKDKGHFGAYLEQGGRKRVHEDAWLYSEFLPIDAGMTTLEQSLQALHYTEWALENERPEFGGRRVWSSNWVPSKWSARELYNGDNYHLALAYFQAGLGDQGWEILQGNLLDSGFARYVPGGQAWGGAGTDFGDILHPFCRAVVEGLFGIVPDLPNGVVRIRPGFPAAWPHARIETPDFSLRFERAGKLEKYSVEMKRPAAVEFDLPFRAAAVRSAACNGAPVKWTVEAGAGCARLRVRVPATARAELSVESTGAALPDAPASVRGNVGAEVRLAAPAGEILEVWDPQQSLASHRVAGREIRATLGARAGHSLVLARVRTGELERWTWFRIRIDDPAGDARRASRTPRRAPQGARWQPLDIARHLNGDVRAIHKQQYLSPRPRTVSARIGVDGYSPWTFAPWKIDPPAIDLSRVEGGRITAPQGPHFVIGGERNIAFTSLWDNWPERVAIPVGEEAEAVWLLVAGSTNPMQTRIANARLHFRYAAGEPETLDLVPPLNLWSLCPLGDRDYDYKRDRFCLPPEPPPMLQLGNNCRGIVLCWKLRPGARLEEIALEALSQEVVIGLMAVSLMNPRRRGGGS